MRDEAADPVEDGLSLRGAAILDQCDRQVVARIRRLRVGVVEFGQGFRRLAITLFGELDARQQILPLRQQFLRQRLALAQQDRAGLRGVAALVIELGDLQA